MCLGGRTDREEKRDAGEHNPVGSFIPSVTQHPISTDESRQDATEFTRHRLHSL